MFGSQKVLLELCRQTHAVASLSFKWAQLLADGIDRDSALHTWGQWSAGGMVCAAARRGHPLSSMVTVPGSFILQDLVCPDLNALRDGVLCMAMQACTLVFRILGPVVAHCSPLDYSIGAGTLREGVAGHARSSWMVPMCSRNNAADLQKPVPGPSESAQIIRTQQQGERSSLRPVARTPLANAGW